MASEPDLVLRFTQLPNILMDYIIPLLRESEEKVLLYVLRRTYGFHDAEGHQKKEDSISFSQFIGGHVSHEGRILDFGCGIGRAKLVEALAFLQAIDLVQRIDAAAGKAHAGRGATGKYRLNLKSGIVQKVNQYLLDPVTSRERMVHFLNQTRLMVQKMNQLRQESRKLKRLETNGSESEPLKNGSESEPRMVQKVNLQKKEKESKKATTKETPPSDANASDTPRGVDDVSESPGNKRGTRLPKDWQPSQADLQWAHRKGYHSLINIEDATEEFCKYWWSLATRATKLDWALTWQNRIQELAKREKDRRSNAVSHLTPAERRIANNLTMADQFIAKGEPHGSEAPRALYSGPDPPSHGVGF